MFNADPWRYMYHSSYYRYYWMNEIGFDGYGEWNIYKHRNNFQAATPEEMAYILQLIRGNQKFMNGRAHTRITTKRKNTERFYSRAIGKKYG